MGERLAAAAIWTSARLRLAALLILAVTALRVIAELSAAPDAAAPAPAASSAIQGPSDTSRGSSLATTRSLTPAL
ncbi:MAG: hypothetical protein JJU18_00790 [Oceanicaulis sp.]|nr:hypothetical protein [Oceanicaulis sp.]